jgi:CRP-like cAMP-binding protein
MEWALLAPLSEEERRELLKLCRRRRFRKGEVIFHEGDVGDSLHLVDRGHVAMRVTTPRGDVATLLVDGPGSYFGEFALLSDSAQRSTTVAAIDATETLCLQRSQFEELRERHRDVDRILLHAMSADIRRMISLLAEAHFLSVDVRIYRRLVELVSVFGGTPPLAIPLTQDDLASLAGTTRPTVNRVLQGAQDAGAVHLGRSVIEVLDLAWLEGKAAG